MSGAVARREHVPCRLRRTERRRARRQVGDRQADERAARLRCGRRQVAPRLVEPRRVERRKLIGGHVAHIHVLGAIALDEAPVRDPPRARLVVLDEQRVRAQHERQGDAAPHDEESQVEPQVPKQERVLQRLARHEHTRRGPDESAKAVPPRDEWVRRGRFRGRPRRIYLTPEERDALEERVEHARQAEEDEIDQQGGAKRRLLGSP
eukprot:636587-Prymnesium_polylepis.1